MRRVGPSHETLLGGNNCVCVCVCLCVSLCAHAAKLWKQCHWGLEGLPTCLRSTFDQTTNRKCCLMLIKSRVFIVPQSFGKPASYSVRLVDQVALQFLKLILYDQISSMSNQLLCACVRVHRGRTVAYRRPACVSSRRTMTWPTSWSPVRSPSATTWTRY